MTPPWNSSGTLGGPERRQLDRRTTERATSDRRHHSRRARVRTMLLAAAMSSAPAARPMVALLPTTAVVKPRVEVLIEYSALPPDEAYDAMIEEAAVDYDMDADLIRAVMQTESAFHPLVVSRAGAEGLMQLMPELAVEMGVSDSFDPRENIRGGTRYLKHLLDYYDGDLGLALAGYNAGPGNVERYGGIPPFAETRKYVQTITDLLRRSRSSSAD